jgi:1-acyl-sn-glycerol-3-phosphate acyltransferase
VSRAMQSLSFAVIYSIYLVAVMAPVQWLIVRPSCALLPRRRAAIQRAWLHGQARWLLGLARSLGGMRVEIQGALPEESCVVLANHQSLLDIPIALTLLRGPMPLVPTRARYGRGIPGLSGILRMGGHPMLAQGERATRAEHRALIAAADQVARGERSLLLFPEGHRSRDGAIGPFMSAGFELIMRRAPERPVYVVAIDGLAALRTFADIALRLAGTRARVAIRGPFAVPADPAARAAFVPRMREEMLAAFAGLSDRETGRVPAPTVQPRARLAG